MIAGHNSRPTEWHDDERCEDIMKAILTLKERPYVMEAAHLGCIQMFGSSYVDSDFAQIVRREVCNRTGRELP
jgi:hypothetical protein